MQHQTKNNASNHFTDQEKQIKKERYIPYATGKMLAWINVKKDGEAHPTRMPSSISVGETLSPSPTTNCNKGIQMITKN